jgi:hypothetical protein
MGEAKMEDFVRKARDLMKQWWVRHIGDLPRAYSFILLAPISDEVLELRRFLNQTNTFPTTESLIEYINSDDPFDRPSFLREYDDLICNATSFLQEPECIKRYYRSVTRLFLDLDSKEVEIVATEMLDP